MEAEKPKKSVNAEREERILAFWKENRIFEKSVEKDAPHGEVFFYDGPPFATGLPHYGHILAGTIKDVIPRFETMRGKRVVRRWGWDCHGLPIENLIENELGLKHKKDIEEFGIEKFNEAARASVFRYDKEWREIIPRTGRWVDMDNQYVTMSPSYMESVWWSFSELYKKGLVYQGFKAMHLCPHCETVLANFEVAQGYKDITDISVTAKFELLDSPSTGSTSSPQAGSGQAKTYVLAWTTTPWTLPGNVALAVNPDIDYVKVNKENSFFIVAKLLAEKVFKENYEVVKEFRGKDLVGKSYTPLFSYYTNAKLENKENAWKVYAADFVSTEEGTGIVHIAPAFGEDDLNLAQKEKLPVIHHVSRDGKFKKEVTDFAGMDVKPKDGSASTSAVSSVPNGSPQASSKSSGQDHQKADVEVLKNLAHRNLLFAKEKIVHSYPHCWRCETPLLNYADTSWFVAVTKYKDKFIRENKGVRWVPEEIRDGRFGKWLEGARDWAISRSRYWGATLPVWVCEKCDSREVIGSVEELKKKTGLRNRYIVMRHGEAESNTLGVVSEDNKTPQPLTEKGKEEAKKTATSLRREKIDIILTSPLIRAHETAKIVSEIINVEEVVTDDRLKEVQTREFNGKPVSEYQHFATLIEKFKKTPQGGENLTELKSRMGEFLYDIDQKYSGKTILIVTHESPAWMLCAAAEGADSKRALEMRGEREFIVTAEAKKFDFSPLPHSRNYELDLHRPYIDEVILKCNDCGGVMRRVPEVFDTWYESGSMPYASHHYPFEKNLFDPAKRKRFPADFIAEGVDQTRGWFYSLLMLSTALFGKAPYKSVIVNGIVLAEDGQKMAKKLKNYPDVWDVLNNYGADALRYYMIASPVVRAEDFAFSEKGLDEVVKKIILRLLNVYSFYEMYGSNVPASSESTHVLDKWILSRLSELILEVSEGLEGYQLDVASRPVLDFVEDFSVWYLRRSRERFKGEDKDDMRQASATTRFVLHELSKVIAPFMPFLAEEVYQKVKSEKGKESVHLEDWPTAGKRDENLSVLMKETRRVVSLSLEARAKAGIKVRQPLTLLNIKSAVLKGKEDYLSLILDEVNVKHIVFNTSISEEILLETTITAELQKEGVMRDFIRTLQDDRKKMGLTPKSKVRLELSPELAGFFSGWEEELKRIVGIKEISYQSPAEPLRFESADTSFDYRLL